VDVGLDDEMLREVPIMLPGRAGPGLDIGSQIYPILRSESRMAALAANGWSTAFRRSEVKISVQAGLAVLVFPRQGRENSILRGEPASPVIPCNIHIASNDG